MDYKNLEEKRTYGQFIKDAKEETGAGRFPESFQNALFTKAWEMAFHAYGYEGVFCTLKALVDLLEGFDVTEQKRKGSGYMTAEEYLEIEEDSYATEDFTIEEVAAMGPEGRKINREAPSNPYFFRPDMSLFDESLYDGCKIREDAEVKLAALRKKYETEKQEWLSRQDKGAVAMLD